MIIGRGSEASASAAIAPFADVTVGPYGYAFAIGNASAVVYDLLTAWSTGPSTLRGTTVALASDVAAVAVTWTFAADTRETTTP